jgi:hypothetical protein
LFFGDGVFAAQGCPSDLRYSTRPGLCLEFGWVK